MRLFALEIGSNSGADIFLPSLAACLRMVYFKDELSPDKSDCEKFGQDYLIVYRKHKKGLLMEQIFFHFSGLAVIIFVILSGFVTEMENENNRFHKFFSTKLRDFIAIASLVSIYTCFIFSIITFNTYGSLGLGAPLDKILNKIYFNNWGPAYLTGIIFSVISLIPIIVLFSIEYIFHRFRHNRILNAVNVNIADIGFYIDGRGRKVYGPENDSYDYLAPLRYRLTICGGLYRCFLLLCLALVTSWLGVILFIFMLFYGTYLVVTQLRFEPNEATLMALSNNSLLPEKKRELLNKFIKEIQE